MKIAALGNLLLFFSSLGSYAGDGDVQLRVLPIRYAITSTYIHI